MTTVVHRDDWGTLTVDSALGLVRFERSSLSYGSLEDMDRSYAAMAHAIQRVPAGLKLLLDMRQAPPRNDAAFEVRTSAALDQLLRRFPRYATLVRTAVGRLQTARLATERGAEAHVFDDERKALAYLAGAP